MWNGIGHFLVEFDRRSLIAVARDDQCGAGDRGEGRAAVHAPHDGLLLTDEGVRAGVFGHSDNCAGNIFIIELVGVDQGRKQLRADAKEPAPFGDGNKPLPLFDLVGQIGAGIGVEQAEVRYTVRCLPHDFKGDEPAHGQGGEGKPVRGGLEDSGGHSLNAVSRRVVGDDCVGNIF